MIYESASGPPQRSQSIFLSKSALSDAHFAMPNWTFVVGILALWLVLSVAGLFLMSRFGPWAKLARLYPHDDSFVGKTYWFVSLTYGLISYSNCLTATANSDRLSLRIIPPFGAFHPPFTLPRSAVSNVTTRRILFIRSVTFRVGDYHLRLFGSVANAPFWQAE